MYKVYLFIIIINNANTKLIKIVMDFISSMVEQDNRTLFNSNSLQAVY
jgi:hypothetical protein